MASFTIPAIGGLVVVPVSDHHWMDLGAHVHVRGGGNFVVASKAQGSVTLSFTGQTTTAGPGTVVRSGSSVTEGARPLVTPPTDPMMAAPTGIASGGTGAFTIEDARANLELPSIQTGLATLTLGVVTVATAKITADSVVFIQRGSYGTTPDDTLSYVVSALVVGDPGSFTVTAKSRTNATETANDGTINWMVVG